MENNSTGSATITRRSFILKAAAAMAAAPAILAACGGTAAVSVSPSAAAASPSSAAPSAASSAPASAAASASASAASSIAASPASSASSSAGATAKPAAGGKVQMPTYSTPAGAPKPDVPGQGLIPDGYINYPKSPFQSVPKPPGDGSDVTVAGETFGPLIPVDKNTLWSNLNKSLNVNLKLNLAPFADWAFGKFQALVAGGDLPDITMIPIGGVIPELPAFLESKCQDLTPFISGDNIKEYPNLAGLPTVGYQGMVYNNKIFALPIAQSQFYWALWGHKNLLDAAGLSWPKSAQEFRTTLKALTHAQQTKFGIGFETGNRYAYGLTNVGGQIWPAIMGAPNNWGVDSSGKWTKDYATPEFKAAVQLAHDVFADGSFDPDPSLNTITAGQAFEGGRLAFRFDNALNINDFDAGVTPNNSVTPRQNPPWVNLLAPPIPATAGGKGQYNLGIGNFGLIVFKQAPAARIKMLLSVINYIVAPFGSQEYLNVQYGVKDQDYSFDANGNPVRTKQGVQDLIFWGGATGGPPPVLFDPDNKDFAPTMNQTLQPLAAVAKADPTVGLYSATNQKTGFLIQQKFADGMIDIVAGRQPISAFDGILAQWKSSGGDQIAKEYQDAYSTANG